MRRNKSFILFEAKEGIKDKNERSLEKRQKKSVRGEGGRKRGAEKLQYRKEGRWDIKEVIKSEAGLNWKCGDGQEWGQRKRKGKKKCGKSDKDRKKGREGEQWQKRKRHKGCSKYIKEREKKKRKESWWEKLVLASRQLVNAGLYKLQVCVQGSQKLKDR